MANNSGWIKLYRQIIDNPVFSDATRLKAWIYLLCKVNHKREKVLHRGNYVWVEKGQTITSLRQLSVVLKCNPRTVKKILDQFQEEGMITYEIPNGKYTLVTVVKYGVFQGEVNTECNTDYNTECNTDYIQTRMNKNEKNDKNEKKKDIDASAEAQPARKHKFGSYQHVLMTDAEVDKLKTEFGESETQEAITFLDEYIEMKGYKAKSHYLAIRKWVFNAIKEKRVREQKAAQKGPGFQQNNYDFDELEKKLLAN